MLQSRIVETPIGAIQCVASKDGVRSLKIGKEVPKELSAPDDDQSRKSIRAVEKILDQCEKQLSEYFAGTRKEFQLPLDPQGTEFQKKVWNILSKIPYGRTISYSQQAKTLGNPLSVRAVAAANGRNPIGIIVPCHRVVAANGHLHGFAGGLTLKKKILEIEGVKVENLRVSLPYRH